MKNAEAAPAPRADSEKEFRTRAMARPRSTARSYPHRRRSAARVPGTMAVAMAGDEASALRRYWDEHAIKTGMAVFWGWFLLANWSNLAQVAQEFARF